jgi:hypothetical protein
VSTFAHAAAIFNAWTGQDLTAREGAIFLQCIKKVRRWQNPAHRDSYVDDMAYIGIEFECAQAEVEGG